MDRRSSGPLDRPARALLVTSGPGATFGHLHIACDERVLRPRAWTIAQSWWAAQLVSGGSPRVLELCAGAGQIGLLTLALSPSPAGRLVAVDSNPIACDFIRQNALRAGLADRVEVRHGDLDAILDPWDRFDLIVADPPWVEHDRVPDHPEDPVVAIDGGADGLDVATACLRVAGAHLREEASMLLQLGSASQVTEVVRRAEASGSRLGFVEARHFGKAGSLVRFVAAVA